MLRDQSRVLGLALALAGAFGPSAAHAQYGGAYGGGGGYGGDFGGYNPLFDPSMMPGFGYDFGPDGGPMPGKAGVTPAPNPVLQLLALVNRPAVQEDLKLTDDQKVKLKDLASKRPAARASKPSSSSSKSAATSSRTKTSGGSNAQAALAAIAALQKQLDDLLDAGQRKRLEQIALQVEGPLAVAKPEVAKKINLTAAQVKQVRSIIVEARNQLAQLGPPNPPPTDKPPAGGDPGQSDQPPDRAQFEQVRQAAGGRVMEVLKPAQKDAFKQLLGPPFDVARLRAAPAPADAASPESRPNAQPQPKSRGPLRKPGGLSPSP
jgi:hypothetical protein